MKTTDKRCDPAELATPEQVAGFSGQIVKEQSAKVVQDLGRAAGALDDARKVFSTSLDALFKAQADVSVQTKKVTGELRDHHQKLGDALSKVSAAADFPKLEKYVALLERAASAMQILAELEKSGHLVKISSALR